mmetsp:Transcript_3639/g.11054  ORF Transcript_3639/g.11054 Transcript_3639/m.11054 type:complete len:327 (-) Transcript_3639:123-1103(-)
MCKGACGSLPLKAVEQETASTECWTPEALVALADTPGVLPPADALPLSPPRSGGVEGTELIDCIARALLCTLSENHAKRSSEGDASIFNSTEIPLFPLAPYLQRLYRVFRASDSAFVCAAVILDRLLKDRRLDSSEDVELTVWNVHRLFLACAVLAAKYNEDRCWRNSKYAEFSGIDVGDLNRYELFLLDRLDFRLGVDVEEFQLYKTNISAMTEPSAKAPMDPFELLLAQSQLKVNEKLVWRRELRCFGGLSVLLRCLGITEAPSRLGDATLAAAPKTAAARAGAAATWQGSEASCRKDGTESQFGEEVALMRNAHAATSGLNSI